MKHMHERRRAILHLDLDAFFELVTRASSRMQGFQSAQEMLPVLRTLLAGLVDGKRAVRLLGVIVSGLLSPGDLHHARQFVTPSLWEEQHV